MTTLQFPLRFLDAIRLGDDDDTVYYVVGLVPDWRIHSFVVWMMTAPDGIEAWAPLTQVRVIQEDDDRGRLPQNASSSKVSTRFARQTLGLQPRCRLNRVLSCMASA